MAHIVHVSLSPGWYWIGDPSLRLTREVYTSWLDNAVETHDGDVLAGDVEGHTVQAFVMTNVPNQKLVSDAGLIGALPLEIAQVRKDTVGLGLFRYVGSSLALNVETGDWVIDNRQPL